MVTTELLDRLQNGTHTGRGVADQSVHGMIGLWTARKAETSWMKNNLIESSGGKKIHLLVKKNCIFTEILI
jgi:hypothetical protein